MKELLPSEAMTAIVADDKSIEVGKILSRSIFEQRGVSLITVDQQMLAVFIAIGVQATKDVLSRELMR